MKILKIESYDNAETYKAAFNDIVKRASFGAGPGYELISGSSLTSELNLLINIIAKNSDNFSNIVNDDNVKADYIDVSKDVLAIADDLSAKAVMLHQAAKAAKDLVKQIKSDIEKSTDTYISLEG